MTITITSRASSSQITDHQSGQILLLVLVFMVIVTSVVVSLVGYAALQIKSHRQAVAREQGINIAEAGAELAIWKLNNQGGYSGEINVPYANGVYDVVITNLNAVSKLIKVDSYVPDKTNPTGHRSVQVTAVVGGTNVGFNYGIQVGNGGLEMTNSSKVIGNVYANSNISGENSAMITGTAIVAGASGKIQDIRIDGDAKAHFIENSDIGGNTDSYDLKTTSVDGNVVATTITSCSGLVGGNATYDTKSNCNVAGTETTPNPADFSDPEIIPLPITDEQIADWEAAAAAGGVIGSQIYSSGISSLGPKKIDGDLTVKNTAVLNITGTVWVTGHISFENTSIVQLDPGYGGLSEVVLAGVSGSTTAGLISLKNSAEVKGSGTAGSYIMLLSEMVNTNSISIDAGNTGSVAILYAGNGLVDLNNSGQFKEITAAKIRTSNTATVSYESGLANPLFSSGPSGGWQIQPQSWQLLQ